MAKKMEHKAKFCDSFRKFLVLLRNTILQGETGDLIYLFIYSSPLLCIKHVRKIPVWKLLRRSPLNLGKVVLSSVQLGFEHLQEERLHILLRHIVQCLIIFRAIPPLTSMPKQNISFQHMTMASARPRPIETEPSWEITHTIYTTVSQGNFHLSFLFCVLFPYAFNHWLNEFGWNLCHSSNWYFK